jgi:hypothetical protein
MMEARMSLRGRVGRHTQSGGRQCQNWVDDQQTVMDLLNAIPVMKGGAGGSLGGRIVLGIASEALCRAISRFEDKYFPGQRSGFIDPGGKMWNRLMSEVPMPLLRIRMTQVFVSSYSSGAGKDYESE